MRAWLAARADDVAVQVGTSLESGAQVAEVKPIKPEQIDALMPFLGKFDEAGFSAGDWQVEEGPSVSWFNWDESVMEFTDVFYWQ